MFLSGDFIGISTFKNATGGVVPLRRQYTKIRVFGSAIIDKLQVRNLEIDNETLRNTAISDNRVWTPETLLLSEFENGLPGGNIANLDSPVTQWQISRKESGSSVLKDLGIVDVGVTELVDYSCQANKKYIYQINALTDTQISEGLITEEIEMDFFAYYLVDIDEGKVYKFDLNVVSGSREYNEDVIINKNYSKYPSISTGQSSYFSTSISCICGTIDINGELLQSIDYVSELRDFILNGKNKIFKTRKGEIYKVHSHNYSESQFNDGIEQQVIIVSFDLVQVGDI